MGGRFGVAAVVSLSFLVGVGCAGLQPSATPEPQDLIVRRNIDQVWPEVERLLQEKGWMIEPREPNVLSTTWRMVAHDQLVPGGTGQVLVERVVVAGKPLAQDHTSLRLVRQTRVMRVVELGKSIGPNVQAQTQPRSGLFASGGEYHSQSHQDVGPEQPIRVDPEPALEQELATRLSATSVP